MTHDEDQSLNFMLSNYTKRFSLTTYGGVSWSLLSGFEQVLTNGVPTYYVVDWGVSRVVTYDQYWNYQTYQALPCSNSYAIKYVAKYFYFTSDDYFYKTNSNFGLVSYYTNGGACYRQMYYDSSSSKFYAAPFQISRIDVFNTNCILLQTISLGSNAAYGLSYFNGSFYAGIMNSNQVFVIQNNVITKQFILPQCSVSTYQMLSITADSFGYLAINCQANKYIAVYDYNGNYMNTAITTSSSPFITGIDSSSRFVIMDCASLDIYY